MTWYTRGTEHNVKVRGGGTWGDQSRRLYTHQKKRYRQEMGRGTWAARDRRLIQSLRRRERGQAGKSLRHRGKTLGAGALVLGAVLVMAPGTRGTGLMILALSGLVLYMISKG